MAAQEVERSADDSEVGAKARARVRGNGASWQERPGEQDNQESQHGSVRAQTHDLSLFVTPRNPPPSVERLPKLIRSGGGVHRTLVSLPLLAGGLAARSRRESGTVAGLSLKSGGPSIIPAHAAL